MILNSLKAYLHWLCTQMEIINPPSLIMPATTQGSDELMSALEIACVICHGPGKTDTATLRAFQRLILLWLKISLDNVPFISN